MKLDALINGIDPPEQKGLCAFITIGGGRSTTIQTNYQTTNVGVEVNPAFHFGSEFLQPLATTLGQINQGIIERFAPLAEGIQGSIDNTNRLAADLRRTADFSISPAVAPAGGGPSPILMLGAVVLGVLIAKLVR